MSLHTLATHMAQTGRGPDSMLVHMSPREVESLQAIAKANGGSLTINPHTGLPEAGFLDSLLPTIIGIALAPETGGASLGLTEAWQTAALVGGVTGLATGSLSKGLMAGLGAYGGAGLGNSLAAAGVNDVAANMAFPTDAASYGGMAPTEGAYGAFGEAPTVPAGQAMTDASGNVTSAADASRWGSEGYTAPPTTTSLPTPDVPVQPASPVQADLAIQQNLPQTATPGPTAPPTGLGKLQQGIQNLNANSGWGQFAKENWKPLASAGAAALLSAPQPTVKASASSANLGGFHTGYYDPYSGKYVDTGGYIPYKDWGDKNIRDYTHAKEGGLMSLCGGGAVAFADGGTTMTSPYMNGLAHPETIPLMSGETQEQGLARLQAQQDELNQRVQNRMAMSGQEPQTINWTQSPAGLNPSSPTVQTQADVDYWTRRAADAQNSNFTAGGGGGGGGGQSQVDYIKSLMANNPAPVGPTNAQMMYDQQLEQARTKANREAVGMYNTGDGFEVTGGYLGYDPKPNETNTTVVGADGKPRYLTIDEANKQKAYADSLFEKYKPTTPTAPVAGKPDVPAAGGTPTTTSSGIQTLTSADANAPAATTPPPAPSGVQQLMKDGHLIDPTTGHLVNPTLSAQQMAEAKGNMPEMQSAYKQYWDTVKPGDVLDFAGGTLTRNPDGTATHTYKDANGNAKTYTFTPTTTIETVAKSDPMIAAEWKSMFGYVPASGTGGPGTVVQNPNTGWTPPVAPPTRVPTSIEDFNTRFNHLTGDSKAAYDYLMGKTDKEPKSTVNAGPIMKPYWEAVGSKAPVYKPIKPTTTPDEGKEWTYDAPSNTWKQTPVVASANGGLMGYAAGGLGSLGGYSDGGRLLKGPGDGVSDSIPASIADRQPARLADGEFVVPARIVSELGNGSTEAGARRLYQMMDRVQNARKKSVGKGKVATDSRAEQYLPA